MQAGLRIRIHCTQYSIYLDSEAQNATFIISSLRRENVSKLFKCYYS
jgi:hypothetical protein